MERRNIAVPVLVAIILLLAVAYIGSYCSGPGEDCQDLLSNFSADVLSFFQNFFVFIEDEIRLDSDTPKYHLLESGKGLPNPLEVVMIYIDADNPVTVQTPAGPAQYQPRKVTVYDILTGTYKDLGVIDISKDVHLDLHAFYIESELFYYINEQGKLGKFYLDSGESEVLDLPGVKGYSKLATFDSSIRDFIIEDNKIIYIKGSCYYPYPCGLYIYDFTTGENKEIVPNLHTYSGTVWPNQYNLVNVNDDFSEAVIYTLGAYHGPRDQLYLTSAMVVDLVKGRIDNQDLSLTRSESYAYNVRDKRYLCDEASIDFDSTNHWTTIKHEGQTKTFEAHYFIGCRGAQRTEDLNPAGDEIAWIGRLSTYAGPVGTTIEIYGRNFSGFEGDLNAWIENESGGRGILYGDRNSSNVRLIRVTLRNTLCQVDTSYSGLPCPSWLNLTPGIYKIYVNPWGKKSNEMKFTITE